jgi:hypothetical protein
MAVYRFRYADGSGSAVRTTIMQCADDAEAVHKACHTMQDRYAMLEIFEGERLVYSKFPQARQSQGN